jgi:hypothetical protein
MAEKRFFQNFDQLWQLQMWYMQLVDKNHLFINTMRTW